MHTTRREFLIGGVRVAATVPMLGGLGLAGGSTLGGERALVVIQLTGGNDGLNTVVPIGQDAYYQARPNLAVSPKAALRLEDGWGLHPQMRPLKDLYEDGKLAVVHAVGHPSPNRSHFRSMEIWHTADPDGPPAGVGWMGRLADQLAERDPASMPALQIGNEELPLSLYGRKSFTPTVRDAGGFRLNEPDERFATARDRLLQRQGGGELAFLRGAARMAYEAAERMASMAERSTPIPYPGSGLARSLALVARLVAGEFGTRLFHVSLGGFDTHARQDSVHPTLLAQLAGALSAFQRDLAHHGVEDRVTTMVFSEFGRRVSENASEGTDHGQGAPVLLCGSRVRAGFHGEAPDLDRLDDGDVPWSTDFRAIYSELEGTWMGLRAGTRVLPQELLRG